MSLRNFITACCFIAFFVANSFGQSPNATAPAAPEPPPAAQDSLSPLNAADSLTLLLDAQDQGINYRFVPVDDDLHRAVERYRNSVSDSDAREQAKEDIQTALNDQYDAYLKNQEEQLDAMETRLGELREQLKQRKTAKQKMVDLKFEMLLAQLEGLGWPEREDSAGIGRGRFTQSPILRQLNLQSHRHQSRAAREPREPWQDDNGGRGDNAPAPQNDGLR